MKIRLDQNATITCDDVTLVNSDDAFGPHIYTTYKCHACTEVHVIRIMLSIREVLFTREWCDRIHVKGSLS